MTAKMLFHAAHFALVFALVGWASASQLNMIPKYAYAPDTVKYCAWWLDNDGTWTCDQIQQTFGLSMSDFQRWNPSVVLPCSSLTPGQSYCIAASESRQAILTVTSTVTAGVLTVPVTIPIPVTAFVTKAVTSILTTTVTVTQIPKPQVGGNGITTPLPYQPGMVDNCKTFYLVQPGDTCVNIAARYNITPEQIVSWNPNSRIDCTRLLANNYCCVGVL